MPGHGKGGGNETRFAAGLHPERGGRVLEDLHADVRGICLGSGAVSSVRGRAGTAVRAERGAACAAVWQYRRLTGIETERRSAETGQNNRKAASKKPVEYFLACHTARQAFPPETGKLPAEERKEHHVRMAQNNPRRQIHR